jgi:lycopene cyclase domain-containing protein
MIYSDLAIAAVVIAVMIDLFVFKNSLLTRVAFWISYSIILPFQLITNWWLTHYRSDGQAIVMYDPNTIIGTRIAGAPLEDLLFGFALILSTMGLWEFWGRRGFQREKITKRKVAKG